MDLYVPSDKPERLVASSLGYGLVSWFYNKGHYRTVKEAEARYLDQRSFGPAAAKGLIAFDGVIWYLTENGAEWVKRFETRDPWKESASREYSHYIRNNTRLYKTLRVLEGGKKKPQREAGRPLLRRVNGAHA